MDTSTGVVSLMYLGFHQRYAWILKYLMKPREAPVVRWLETRGGGKGTGRSTTPTCGNTGGSVQKEPKSQVQRNREWREKHPEQYRDYMRRYMREYRQGLKRRKGELGGSV